MTASRPAVVAKSRFQIDLFDQHLVGSGSYHEASYVQDRLLRVETKITVAGELASFQRVSDGRYAWTRRDVPGINGQTVPLVGRIDLQRVAERRGSSGTGPPPEYPIGGIAYLLSNLLSRYEFSAGRPLTHQGLPAVIVRGHLRPSSSAARSENDDRRQALEEAPGLVPGSVTLVVGQQDLFPFVIQYHAALSDPVRGARQDRGTDDGAPIMTIEYYEVDFPTSLDPRLFMYHAGEIAIHDDTEEFLRAW